jgi:hypothetical protein
MLNSLLRPLALILNAGLLVVALLMVLQGQAVMNDLGDVVLAILLIAAPASALLLILRFDTAPRSR